MSEATQTVAAGQLRAFIERVEKLEEMKAEIAAEIKEVFSEMKSTGFSVPTVRTIIKMRKQDQAEREEAEAILDVYLGALGMLPQGDLFVGGNQNEEITSGTVAAQGVEAETKAEKPAKEITGRRFKATRFDDGSAETVVTDYDKDTGEVLNVRTSHEQARFPSQGALEADPACPRWAGSADQFNDTGPHVFSDHEPLA